MHQGQLTPHLCHLRKRGLGALMPALTSDSHHTSASNVGGAWASSCTYFSLVASPSAHPRQRIPWWSCGASWMRTTRSNIPPTCPPKPRCGLRRQLVRFGYCRSVCECVDGPQNKSETGAAQHSQQAEKNRQWRPWRPQSFRYSCLLILALLPPAL